VTRALRRLCVWAGLAAVALAAQSPAGGLAAAPPVPESSRVALGAYIPHASYQPGRIDRYGKLVGRKPVIVSYYRPWTEPAFVRSELAGIWNRGAMPMITWEPWDWEDHHRHFPLAAIAAGRYDAYVRRSARAAAAWGRPVLLRFAHEMNGTWYPWGSGRDGNTPADYRHAWKHLVRTFRRYGADNVQWVWAPNVNNSGKFPFRKYYPGDAWVDWVGLDGFNWASRGDWNSFTSIFADSYDNLTQITSRPVMVTETASNQSGGDKAAWVASALRREIPKFTAIRAVVWFTEPFGGVDARIDSSRAALHAFRAAAASPRYSMTRGELLATPPVLARESLAPESPSGGFGEPSFFYRITHKLHGKYLWYAIGMVAAALAIVLAGAIFLRRRLRARAAS
jgi:Glycosyl hydrolase family 26